MPTPRRVKKAAPSQPADLFDHAFRDTALLERALTHRSLSYETDPQAVDDPSRDNEQLEFVGDAVLGLIVAESLFRRFPASREGELTRLRAILVSRRHLAEVGERLGLGALLQLGRGEEHSGGRRKPALLANAMEAVIAALYLDGGLEAAARFVERHVVAPATPTLEEAVAEGSTFSGVVGDHKSALQEILQARGDGQPRYVVLDESGPDHRKLFRVQVGLGGLEGSLIPLAQAVGPTKKFAQQEAARLALVTLAAESTRSPGSAS